jgi:uncharacterized membrane protein YcaP (DUF421 family)
MALCRRVPPPVVIDPSVQQAKLKAREKRELQVKTIVNHCKIAYIQRVFLGS